MAQSDPEPAPEAAPTPEPAPTTEPVAATEPAATKDSAVAKSEAKGEAKSGSGKDSEEKSEPETPEEAAERSRRSVRAFEWSCSWLTLLAGVFVIAGMYQTGGGFNALAWLGLVVVVVCMLALIALYVGCARDRVTLRTRIGPVDLFQASTVVVVIAVVCGLVVPTGNHSALSLLLPWALTYWIYGMDRAKPPTSSGPTSSGPTSSGPAS
jgi:cation transport ATPase